jgi:hypothetical protein
MTEGSRLNRSRQRAAEVATDYVSVVYFYGGLGIDFVARGLKRGLRRGAEALPSRRRVRAPVENSARTRRA